MEDFAVELELFVKSGGPGSEREKIGQLSGDASSLLSIDAGPFKFSPLTDPLADVPYEYLLECAERGLSCRVLVSLEVAEGDTRTVVLYDNVLADWYPNDQDDDASEDEWRFEWGNISNCCAPDGIATDGGVTLFMYPIMHQYSGKFSFGYHGSTEMGWSLEREGESLIDDDVHIRRLLGTGIPWHRVRERPSYNLLAEAPPPPGPTPVHQLRPMEAAFASGEHWTRRNDFLLTFEVLGSSGELLLSHTDQATHMLRKNSFIPTKPDWLESATQGDLTCRVLVTKKTEKHELLTALIYPVEQYGSLNGSLVDLPTVTETSHPKDKWWRFEQASPGGGWVGTFASAWMAITPSLALFVPPSLPPPEHRTSAFSSPPPPPTSPLTRPPSHLPGPESIVLRLDFSIACEETGYVDFTSHETDRILDWFDDGIPWHRVAKARLPTSFD